MSSISIDASQHAPSGSREQWSTRAVFLVAGLAMAAWAPLVPFAKDRVGVEEGAFGVLLLCLGLGSILAMPVTGILASRHGCRRVTACATVVLAAAVPLLAIADTVVALALSLALFGASVGTLDVAMNIQAVMVEKDSGRNMMSGFHGLFSVGGIFGAGGVSLLLATGLSPLNATFIVSAMLLLLLLASWKGLLPYGNRDEAGTPAFVMPRGIVLLIGLLCFLVFLGEGAVLDWSAIFLIGAHGVEETQAGFGYTLFAVAMAIGRLFGDHLVKAMGGTRIVVLGGALGALGFCLAVFAPTQPLAFAGFLLVGLGASNIVPVFFTAAGEQKRMPQSLAIAAITTMGYAGILVGPAAIGFVGQHWSLATGFILVAIGLAFVAITGPIASRRG
ncbi:MFS transporter [Devosia yakushimensis]|nr:MFS transporter [Devosia yakushimensis]